MGTTESWDSKYATVGSLYELKARRRKKSGNLLRNALTFWSYESLSTSASTPNLLVKKNNAAAVSSSGLGRNGRRSHSVSACVSEVTKCALQILYSGRDTAPGSPAGTTSPDALAIAAAALAVSSPPSKNGLTTSCCLVGNNKPADHSKLNGVTCHQKRRLHRLPMRQIHEEGYMLEETGENYDISMSEELPPSPPPPPPPPMPPETSGTFNKEAINISKMKFNKMSPLPEELDEDVCDNRMMDEMLMKRAGAARFQSRLHSWPETASERPVQRNCCPQCYGETPPRRLSAPVPICVTYYTRVRLRSFSHLLASVTTQRRCHGDACTPVSTYQKTLYVAFGIKFIVIFAVVRIDADILLIILKTYLLMFVLKIH